MTFHHVSGQHFSICQPDCFPRKRTKPLGTWDCVCLASGLPKALDQTMPFASKATIHAGVESYPNSTPEKQPSMCTSDENTHIRACNWSCSLAQETPTPVPVRQTAANSSWSAQFEGSGSWHGTVHYFCAQLQNQHATERMMSRHLGFGDGMSHWCPKAAAVPSLFRSDATVIPSSVRVELPTLWRSTEFPLQQPGKKGGFWDIRQAEGWHCALSVGHAKPSLCRSTLCSAPAAIAQWSKLLKAKDLGAAVGWLNGTCAGSVWCFPAKAAKPFQDLRNGLAIGAACMVHGMC